MTIQDQGLPQPSTPSLTRIVLTGGPAGGKTSALPRLASHLRGKQYTVLTMPEIATYFLASNGFTYEELEDKKGFQRDIVGMILACEKIYERVANELASKDMDKSVIVISDRGILDASVCKPMAFFPLFWDLLM